MAKKRIFTIGFDLPSEEFHYIPFDSDQSLLDADIILFEPSFGSSYASEDHNGIRLFNKSTSHTVYENLRHWRSELTGAVDAGKLVIVFLTKPLNYVRYTGQQTFSGTGRSRTTTNIVAEISTYDSIPMLTKVEAKTGREVRLTKEGAYLATYWKDFAEYSSYEAFIEGKFIHKTLTTKLGEKIVGAAIRGKGWLLFLPPIHYDEEKFQRYDSKKDDTLWTPEALEFGKRLVASLVGIADTLLAGHISAPPPEWVSDSTLSTTQELELQLRISETITKITELQEQRSVLEKDLTNAGAIRALLYEQGKPLERAVVESLAVLGFSANPFTEGDSEFDVVFLGPEGRFIGEVEGKDNKLINIDKLSQLERNLQEDFAREGITEYAKGILLGNAERLTHPSKRGNAFTNKVLIGAKRAGIGLVRTSDLFEPVRYLKDHADSEYAKSCREAIFAARGEIVVFPTPPVKVKEKIMKPKKKTAPPVGEVKEQ